MADADASKGLAPGWEAVTADDGRTYWWNVTSGDTTWEKPVEVVAKKGIAAGYLNKVKQGGSDEVSSCGGAGSSKSASSTANELEGVRRQGGGVSARLAMLQGKGQEEPSPGAQPKASASWRSPDVDGAAKKMETATLVGSDVGKSLVDRQLEMGVRFGQRGPPALREQQERLAAGPQPEQLAVEAPDSKRSSGSDPPASPGMVEGRSKSMSVDALKKYQEAKKFMAEKESATPPKGATPRGSGTARAAAPPKVDLYS